MFGPGGGPLHYGGALRWQQVPLARTQAEAACRPQLACRGPPGPLREPEGPGGAGALPEGRQRAALPQRRGRGRRRRGRPPPPVGLVLRLQPLHQVRGAPAARPSGAGGAGPLSVDLLPTGLWRTQPLPSPPKWAAGEPGAEAPRPASVPQPCAAVPPIRGHGQAGTDPTCASSVRAKPSVCLPQERRVPQPGVLLRRPPPPPPRGRSGPAVGPGARAGRPELAAHGGQGRGGRAEPEGGGPAGGHQR